MRRELCIAIEVLVAFSVADVITCAKFQDEIFRGYNFTGVEFPIFPYIFACALQQQLHCAACDLRCNRRRARSSRHGHHHEWILCECTFEFIQQPLHTGYSTDAVIHISQLLHTVLLHVLQTLWVNSKLLKKFLVSTHSSPNIRITHVEIRC